MAIKGKGDEWVYIYAIKSDGLSRARTVSIVRDRIFCDCQAFDRMGTCEHLEIAWQLHSRQESRNKYLGLETIPKKE